MLVLFGIIVTALITSWLTTPLCSRLASRLGIVDSPGIRKQHVVIIPYLGGAAVLLGLVAGVMLLGLLSHVDDRFGWAAPTPKVLAILAGGAAMFSLGLLDDIRPLRARYKMLAQVIIATGLWSAGVCINAVPIANDVSIDLGLWSLPITVIWIVGATNAWNLIDGLDGLATGLGAISAAAIAVIALQFSGDATGYILAALAASLLGFLYYNRHPAQIFLGDSGSLLIGCLLATCALAAPGERTDLSIIAAPLIALALPILDMTFAVLRRVIERRGLFSPDRNHIHHRLLARGLSHTRVVHSLWSQSGLLTAITLLLLHPNTSTLHCWVSIGTVMMVHVLFFRASGAVRLRESYVGFRNAATRLQEIRSNNRVYDGLELAFRSAKNMDDYWRSIELSGSRLGLTHIALNLDRRDGSTEVREWRAPNTDRAALHSTLPVKQRRSGDPLLLKVEIEADSLESAALRIALLGKLLDRHSVATLPRSDASLPTHSITPRLGRIGPSDRRSSAGS